MEKMPRALRRRILKEKVSTILLNEIMEYCIGGAISDYSVAITMVMLDKVDVPKERIPDMLAEVVKLFESISEGHVDIEDLYRTIFDETGINLRGDS